MADIALLQAIMLYLRRPNAFRPADSIIGPDPPKSSRRFSFSNTASICRTLGTTIEEIAAALKDHRGLRVIIDNLHVATLMSAYRDCEVIVAGGPVRPRDHGVTGESAIRFIEQFRADYALMSIAGDGALLEFD